MAQVASVCVFFIFFYFAFSPVVFCGLNILNVLFGGMVTRLAIHCLYFADLAMSLSTKGLFGSRRHQALTCCILVRSRSYVSYVLLFHLRCLHATPTWGIRDCISRPTGALGVDPRSKPFAKYLSLETRPFPPGTRPKEGLKRLGLHRSSY